MFQQCMADQQLQLKVGAEVMCIQNLDLDGEVPIANGSRGVVVRFEPGQLRSEQRQLSADGTVAETLLPVVEFSYRGRTRTHVFDRLSVFDCSTPSRAAARKQIPLKLAWALCIHKSQGMTIQGGLGIDFARGFVAGQGYTALSRTTALANVEIRNFDPRNRGMRANPAVLAFYNEHFPTPPLPPQQQPIDMLDLSSDDEGPDGAVEPEQALAVTAAASSVAVQAAHELLTTIGAFAGDLATFQSSGVATTIIATTSPRPPDTGGSILDAHNRSVIRRSSAAALSGMYADAAVRPEDERRLAEVRRIASSAGCGARVRGELAGVHKLIKELLNKAGIACEWTESRFKRQALLVSKIQVGSVGASSA